MQEPEKINEYLLLLFGIKVSNDLFTVFHLWKSKVWICLCRYRYSIEFFINETVVSESIFFTFHFYSMKTYYVIFIMSNCAHSPVLKVV